MVQYLDVYFQSFTTFLDVLKVINTGDYREILKLLVIEYYTELLSLNSEITLFSLKNWKSPAISLALFLWN